MLRAFARNEVTMCIQEFRKDTMVKPERVPDIHQSLLLLLD